MIDHDHFVQIQLKPFMALIKRHSSPEKEKEIHDGIQAELDRFREASTVFMSRMKIHIKRSKKKRQNQTIPGVTVKFSTARCGNRVVSREFFIRTVDNLCFAIESQTQTHRYPLASAT